jgi:hypothetical protein
MTTACRLEFTGYAKMIIDNGGLIPHTRKALGIDK